MAPAMDHILSGLAQATPSATAAGLLGADAVGSGDSSGSSASSGSGGSAGSSGSATN